jgi:23S rRNA pseudouridine2605 synthase
MTSHPQRTKRQAVPRRSRSGRRSAPSTPQQQEAGPQRIAKLLARAGIASRREIERMIAEGRIALNGEKVTTPATLLDDVAGLTLDGRPVRPAKATRLYRFYKPPATLTAAHDPKGRATIYDRLPKGLPRLMPVGRLDFMTEGLLLLTNDGELKRQLELPRTGVVRTYRARAFGDVSQAQLEALADGVTIEGMHYGSINANLERRTGRNCWIEMSLTEGKNREVRRVLAHLGLQVSRLIRIAYGGFTLEGLDSGQIDEIDPAELEKFRKSLA